MKCREAMTSSNFNYIRELVRDQAALSIEPGKEYFVESRLEPLARKEGFPSFEHMIASLRTGPTRDLHRKVVEAMTNNETSFFRDARVFAMLRNSVLPALAALRSTERSLNIWCAACATGQEPYSVAMLLRECLPSPDAWNLRIIATDISREVLGRARAGRYTQFEVNRGLPANLLVKYVEQHGATWEIRPEIRRMVEFREMNLIHPWPGLTGIHLILMRNVMIYFDVETKRSILARTGAALDPRGYLLLGGSETTMSLDESFEPVSFDGAVVFRRRPAPARMTT